MSITKQAMVLNLQIGIWQGYRLDKDASKKVTEDANADYDAARVNKHLVPKQALRPVITAANAVRLHFYDKTLPWKDNGDRLLTRMMYMDFIERHEELVGTFKDAVDEFLDTAYPAARDQAEFRMGDLFKQEDYPSVEALRRRFYINLDIDAVTEAGDFRVEMEQSELDTVRKSMEEALQERIGRAMRDVWERLADTLGHFAKKMGSEEIFRDATVRNLREIVELLPGLNVLNDPDLERIRQTIDAKLGGYEAKDLRKDPAVRAAAAKEADEIMESMRGFMNAFGGDE